MKTDSFSKTAKTVNGFLLARLHGSPSNLYQASSHLIEHGGKRLRPFMVIKSCEMLGGTLKDALPAAAAVEMIHNFTLVHDDIMDKDEMRHGVSTVHTKFGVPVGILAGDVLFSKAFEIISSKSNSDNRISIALVSNLAKACVEVCEGQILDMSMAKSSKIPSESQYVTMIEKKTSALFQVSCVMGAICANKTTKDVQNLSSFGKNLGISFQIIDDLIGILGDSKVTKKPVGNDIREGKKSLPILIAIHKAKGLQKKKILQAFGNPSVSRLELESIIKTIKSMGIEKIVRRKALQYSMKARRSLSPYDGKAKRDLLSLLEFVVERNQ